MGKVRLIDGQRTVEAIQGLVTEAGMVIERAECGRCGHPLIRYTLLSLDERWRHDVPGFLHSNRGCRAASFDRRVAAGLEPDWDESLDRKWMATPKKGTVRSG